MIIHFFENLHSNEDGKGCFLRHIVQLGGFCGTIPYKLVMGPAGVRKVFLL
jgi:hypothetical protein